MALITCIECDAEIELGGRPRLGQTLVCISCRTRLEVVSTNPIEVDWADDDGDDWDDDDLDDESFDEDSFADDDGLAYDDDLDDEDDDLEDEVERSWR